MATKTIISDQSKTPVGSKKTELYTRTRITYSLDQNGKVDPNSIKQEILYQQVPGDPPVVAATRNGATGDFTFNKNSFTGETYFGADAQKSLKEGALKATTNQQITTASKKEGLTPEQTKVLSDATKNNASDIEKEAAAKTTSEIKKELENIKERPKNKYTPVVTYPEKLRLEYQDCIKFSMLKYEQSFLNRENRLKLGEFSRSVSLNNQRIPTVGKRTIFTTIVLPIPGGINDSNGVDWQGDSLDEISKAFADIAQSTISQGGEGLESSTQRTAAAAGANIGALQKLSTATFTSLAIGKSGIMQRQYGATLNPNLELLFNGPQLRTFSFNFKLSPRTETEAIIIKKIIRYFKQGMTPKRSSGYLLLQSPHTFAISYLTANKEHPYLNKFKECALTQCNVNYTPEGNYMSFDGAERSMTSYELTLQFQELVPLFDDDYSALDEDQDKVIGF
jgi:Tail-tube assembly protein